MVASSGSGVGSGARSNSCGSSSEESLGNEPLEDEGGSGVGSG